MHFAAGGCSGFAIYAVAAHAMWIVVAPIGRESFVEMAMDGQGIIMIKVIAASSIFILREGMKKILARCKDMEIISEVSCAEDILPGCHGHVGVVVLIAHPLHYRDRHAFYAQLRGERPDCRVVVFVRNDSSEYVLSAIQYGARGILTTDCASTHVPDAIRAVSAGKVYLGEEVSVMIATELKLSTGSQRPRLTERELQILKRIAIGRKSATIAYELGISTKTVSAHKTNILEKLALETESELVLYAIENKLFDLFVDHSKRKLSSGADSPQGIGLRSRGG